MVRSGQFLLAKIALQSLLAGQNRVPVTSYKPNRAPVDSCTPKSRRFLPAPIFGKIRSGHFLPRPTSRGPARESEVNLGRSGEKINAPITVTSIRLLPGGIPSLSALNTAATRDRNEFHSRGDGEPALKADFP